MDSDKLTERLASLSPAKRALLELKLQQGRGGGAGNAAIPRRANRNSAPLSFAQQRLWFLNQLEPESSAYNERSALQLDGPLDINALRGTLNAIVERHEVLRTTYGMTDGGESEQRIGAATTFDLPVIDISELEETRRDGEVQRIAAELRERPFDLGKDRPLRLALIRLSPYSHVLVAVQHHIASDGWSSGVFLRELTALYTSITHGQKSPLSEPPIQYADYALWQRQWLRGEVLEKQLGYWATQLQSLPVLELPTDRPRSSLSSNRGAKRFFTLSKTLIDDLRKLSNQEGTTLFMTLLAAFQILLNRYSGQDDVVVGSPIAGRTRPETEGLIGFFVNMIVLRTKLSGNSTFKELLARVRETALQAYENQDLPFEKLVEELNPERNRSQTPLFQVAFAVQNVPRSNLAIPGLTVSPLEIDSFTAKFDLFAAFIERERETVMRIEYRTELFEARTIERMFDHFQRLLQSVVADPHQRISDLPMLKRAERRQLLVEWNDTRGDYPKDRCIHELFEETVKNVPDTVALIDEDRQITYRELNQRANQLAHHLKKFGVGADVLAGICLEQSAEMIISLIAILKAGAAYVPLDPSYPKERLAFMLQDSGAPVLITQRALVDIFINDTAKHAAKIISLDTDGEKIAQESDRNPAAATSSDSLAYVIYTSGSTGQPKGVAVSHRAVNRLVLNTNYAQLTSTEVVAQASNVSFDAATFEIWGALLNGARSVLIPKDSLLSPQSLSAAIERHGITTLFLTTALFNQMVAQIPDALGKLRYLLFGGEAADPHRVRDLLKNSSPRRLLHVYGPTETTTFASSYWVKSIAADATTVPIGRPIANTEIYILDAHLNPVPIGVAGEIHIGGDGLAQGYLNRPELTAEKFVTHAFDGISAKRLYKTGDLAHYLPDGNIEFLGRMDNQVKVRGYRIELDEIEATLGQLPSIRESVVLAREDSPGDRRLVAYAVAAPGSAPTMNELRSFLKQKLPEYMVPSAFVFLNEIPLTPNGKLDRKALPEPDQSRPELDEGSAAPRTPVEEILSTIWAGILKLGKVDIHDNFFQLGGHSLLATQVISRINDVFATDVQLRRLFETPTIVGLAASIDAYLAAKNDTQRIPPIVPRARTHDAPLSFAQQRLWFLDRLDPDSATYNVPAAFRLAGKLDARALEQSFNEIGRRHEALRTVFTTVNGDPAQTVLPPSPVALTCTDISDRPEKERELILPGLVREEACKPFDLSGGPLLRAKLLRLAPYDHILCLNMHHIVSDGWSMGVLFRELSELYQAYGSGKPSSLPELSVQYADYSVWQRQWLQGGELDRQLSYWRKQLDGISPLQLPTDRTRPRVQTYRGSRATFELSAPLSQALKALSQQQGVTLFMTLLAAFQLLLSRYCGQTDVAVGTPIAGRTRHETERLIGFFVNTLVLRTDLSANPTVTELLRQVRETTLDAYSHQDLPFEKLVEELNPERNLSHSPLFQVMFAFQNNADQPLEFEGLTVQPIRAASDIAKFDLTLTLSEKKGTLGGSLNYNTDLFDASTIERMLGHFQNLLEGIVANPERRISELPLLSAAEKHQLLVEWNDTKHEYPKEKCVHELFEEQAERTPDAIAVIFEDQQLTYRELNNRANQLAHYLQKHDVGPDMLVGNCTGRSIEMVVGLLGILKAGGAYLPLDPSYPPERLRFMFEDTRARVVLTDMASRNSLPPTNTQMICLDRDWEEIAKEPQINLQSKSAAVDLAYVIYTSGSTGLPKGVEVRHQGVARLLFEVDYVQLNEAQTFLHLAPISFDAAAFEVWGALLHGGKCVLFPGEVPSPRELGEVLKKHRVNTLWLTAALFNSVIDEGPQALSEIKQLLIGGEALSVPHVKRGLAQLPNIKIINGYGPTESTTFACCYPIPHDLDDKLFSIPIGKPIGNTQIYILDRDLNPVPVSVPGELHIGGDGLARGYLNQPELTAEKFIPNPFSTEPGARLYKTGDRARYLSDGNIEFLGRVDNQVKIRGYRIELGEIEVALDQHPAVRESVVLAREVSPGDRRLVAYVVAAPGSAPTMNELRSFLKQKLPEYMVPSAYVFVDSLPLTPNGKLDRKVLPAPDLSRPEIDKPIITPCDPLELELTKIWRKILGVKSIGVTDNFFDLGGHSLLAVRLFVEIEKTMGRRLPLATIFQAPTIEQLAGILKREELSQSHFEIWSTYPSAVVPFRANGSKPPLFWFNWGPWDFRLPRYLDSDQPVYGLQHQSQDGHRALYTSIEAMAAHYIKEIRTVKTKGPYFLAGFCVGGMIVFEMARQLQKQGEEVALLVLLDPTNPRSGKSSSVHKGVLSLSSHITWFGNKVYRHLRELAPLETRERLSYALVRVNNRFMGLREKINWMGRKVLLEAFNRPLPPSLRTRYIVSIYERAARAYVPQIYQGRAILFKTQGLYHRAQLRWGDHVAEGLEIQDLDTAHDNVFKEPYVQIFAERLKTHLSEAQRHVTGRRNDR